MQLIPIHAAHMKTISPPGPLPREFTHNLLLRSSTFPPILNSQTLASPFFDSPRYAPRTSTSPVPPGPRRAVRSLSLPSSLGNRPRTPSRGRASRTGRGTAASRSAAGARRRAGRWRRWCAGASSCGFRARRCQGGNPPEGSKDWRLLRRWRERRRMRWRWRAGWTGSGIWSWRPTPQMGCKYDIY